MHPDTEHTITVDPALLVDEAEKEYSVSTPAEKMEHSKILWIITIVAGFASVSYTHLDVYKRQPLHTSASCQTVPTSPTLPRTTQTRKAMR